MIAASETEYRVTEERVNCWKCGRLLFKKFGVQGQGVIEIPCYHPAREGPGKCKAVNAVRLDAIPLLPDRP